MEVPREIRWREYIAGKRAWLVAAATAAAQEPPPPEEGVTDLGEPPATLELKTESWMVAFLLTFGAGRFLLL